MADFHYEFNRFHNRIALTYGNKAMMQMARETIRERIRMYFRNTLQVKPPMFRGQGAYAMNTMVNPIDGEYDIDDGVYLQHLDQQNDGNWPTADTVHRWLMNALDGHCGGKAEGKRACVRVRFRGLYRVDLPVYGQLNGRFRLAVNGASNWPNSDPISLTLWFGSHVSRYGAQLRRIVCYIKAWADFQTRRWGEMPDGFILTVLAVQHYQNRDKDDAALAYTLKAISTAVCSPMYIPNPVNIGEQLAERLTQIQKIKFQEAVMESAADAIEALSLADSHRVLKIWRKVFGDRFAKV
jgi:ABC-type dipeptide/oligopeptide/nickel transport system ATPase component